MPEKKALAAFVIILAVGGFMLSRECILASDCQTVRCCTNVSCAKTDPFARVYSLVFGKSNEAVCQIVCSPDSAENQMMLEQGGRKSCGCVNWKCTVVSK